MHEHFSGLQAADFVGGDSGIRTPYPQVFWGLDVDEALEKARVFFFYGFGPDLVVPHDSFEVVHGDRLAAELQEFFFGHPALDFFVDEVGGGEGAGFLFGVGLAGRDIL